jgi:hypothetical protein
MNTLVLRWRLIGWIYVNFIVSHLIVIFKVLVNYESLWKEIEQNNIFANIFSYGGVKHPIC